MRFLILASAYFFTFVSPIWNIEEDTIFLIKNAEIKFKSDAPLELIQASSRDLAGAIDTEKLTFAFTIPMNSFDGFNSALQKEHFKENYLETHKFPNASFKGKIVEMIDFSGPGTYEVRAKGNMEIHGVNRERIIKCLVEVTEQSIVVKSKFTVLLKDHNIQIPKVVYQKIAEEIYLDLNAEFAQR